MRVLFGLEAKTSCGVYGQVGEVGEGSAHFYVYVQMCSPAHKHVEAGGHILVSSITPNFTC